jgi:hypothetical protein
MPYGFGRNDEELTWQRTELPNVPVVSTRLPPKIMDRIWQYIETAKEDGVKNRSNRILAGNIDTSLSLIDEDDYFWKNVLKKVSEYYADSTQVGVKWWRPMTSHAHKKTCLRSFWVNFQKKHEFNPLHDHAGFLSFVIWMKIPTERRDQHNLPISANSNFPCASDFEFVYTDILGTVASFSVPMGKESEGVMYVFPSGLKHHVYPFYECDEERISVSGNINLDSTSYHPY